MAVPENAEWCAVNIWTDRKKYLGHDSKVFWGNKSWKYKNNNYSIYPQISMLGYWNI